MKDKDGNLYVGTGTLGKQAGTGAPLPQEPAVAEAVACLKEAGVLAGKDTILHDRNASFKDAWTRGNTSFNSEDIKAVHHIPVTFGRDDVQLLVDNGVADPFSIKATVPAGKANAAKKCLE